MRIEILDHEIDVDVEAPDLWKEGTMGLAQLTASTIKVRSDMKPDLIQSTFLHEILHIIEQLGGLEVEHSTIDAFAIGLHSLFKNNPNVLEDIIK